jgi:hypothetical protein
MLNRRTPKYFIGLKLKRQKRTRALEKLQENRGMGSVLIEWDPLNVQSMISIGGCWRS